MSRVNERFKELAWISNLRAELAVQQLAALKQDIRVKELQIASLTQELQNLFRCDPDLSLLDARVMVALVGERHQDLVNAYDRLEKAQPSIHHAQRNAAFEFGRASVCNSLGFGSKYVVR